MLLYATIEYSTPLVAVSFFVVLLYIGVSGHFSLYYLNFPLSFLLCSGALVCDQRLLVTHNRIYVREENNEQ
jgi:regulator of sirC expression with transglutaminase-like and TPR domain